MCILAPPPFLFFVTFQWFCYDFTNNFRTRHGKSICRKFAIDIGKLDFGEKGKKLFVEKTQETVTHFLFLVINGGAESDWFWFCTSSQYLADHKSERDVIAWLGKHVFIYFIIRIFIFMYFIFRLFNCLLKIVYFLLQVS